MSRVSLFCLPIATLLETVLLLRFSGDGSKMSLGGVGVVKGRGPRKGGAFQYLKLQSP